MTDHKVLIEELRTAIAAFDNLVIGETERALLVAAERAADMLEQPGDAEKRKPFRMLVDPEWLKDKILNEPEGEVSAGIYHPEAPADAEQAKWQPIETAPRKADRILVFYVDAWNTSRVKEAWWSIPYDGAPDERGWWQTMEGVLLSADLHKASDGRPLGATHWRPLPGPPAALNVSQPGVK